MCSMFNIKANKNINWNLIITVLAFTAYALFTIKKTFFAGRICWEDEAHFWTIIQNCSIPEIFSLMKVEGHMLMWYLVVMPFAKIGLPYPYPMQIINWLFCFGAMIIMWRKSNFPLLIKLGIMCLPAFLMLYPVHARCYSIGIFFLFSACAIYKERLQKPYLYFTFLAVAANTSLQALAIATGMGIVFLFELYQKCYTEKKNFYAPIIITIITTFIGILLGTSLIGAPVPDYENVASDWLDKQISFIQMFMGTTPITTGKIDILKIWGARLLALIISAILFYRKKILFIFLFSCGTMGWFFSHIYRPRVWHIAFFIVYIIVSYWLFIAENPTKKLKVFFTIILYAIILMVIPLKTNVPNGNPFLNSTFEKNPELGHNAKVFTDITPIVMSVMLPKFQENNIIIYDMHNRQLNSYDALKDIFNKNAKVYSGKELAKYLSNTETNYLVSIEDLVKENKYTKELNLKLYIEGEQGGHHYRIYKISKK